MTDGPIDLDVEIVFSGFQSTDKDMPHGIGFYIKDRKSLCEIFRGTMSFEEFAKAITSRTGYARGTFAAKNAGKRYEHKTEFVPDGDNRLEPFEVDGWKARESDLKNYHHRVPGGHTVVFTRHVDD